MPKLRSENVKYVNGLAVDKENDNVIYNDEKHLYSDKKTGSKYTSVTTLLHKYTQPFDETFWTRYKACEALLDPDMWRFLKKDLLQTRLWKDEYLSEYDIDVESFNIKVEEIKESYKKNRETAAERGVKIHAKFEDMYSKPGSVEINKYGMGGTFKTNAGNYRLNCEKGLFPEFLISYKFDDYLMLAGQIDLLGLDGNDVYIIDYKSNKKIDSKSYYDKATRQSQKMKFPVNHLDDCNLNLYNLQLSCYAYLLQKINPKFKIKKLIIHHIDHDGNETEYDLPYLKDEVERILVHFRKENKKKMLLEKDKPISW